LIKIRLQRKGRIRRPIYHIVVADSRAPRDGRIIEQVGRYDGVTEKKETVLNEDRILYWLETGAQPTDSVRKILRQEGLLYKHHLMMWGKSEEEITVALSEWKAYRDSKKEEEVTHRDQVKAALASEEKEYKTQVTKQATATVKEVAEEAPAEEPAVEEAVEEALAEEPVAEEASAEEPAAEAKTSTDMSAKDAAKYIAATDLANLDGFVTEAEERKTVLAALEAKKAE
jgi:small subunit ribosomal protein S16